MAKKDDLSALDSHLGYWLRVVSNHVSHSFQRKVEAKGVTVAEWVVLRTLYDSGESPPSRIALSLGLTRGAVSKLVARLVKKRMVRCRGAKNDKRFQVLELTRAGQKLVPVLVRMADENDAECFKGMSTEDRQDLKNTLRDLAHERGWRGAPLE